MPFDGSGNYALSDTIAPATNADANELQAILTDIGTALDACVVADGQSPITGALKGADGTVALPAYAFNADLDSGFYRIGANNIGLSLGGTKRWDYGTAGATLTGTFTASGQILSSDGTKTAPGCSFSGDVDTGFYRIGANNIGISCGDTKILDIATTGMALTGLMTISSTLGVTGDVAVNTNKFNVTAASGNTTVAGTLGVTGAVTHSSTTAMTGDVAVNTNKFNVTASNGNTAVAGTLAGASSILSSAAVGGVGYATGAGGTVTQGAGSGKATTVVLNTLCGEITMNGATLNAGVIVSFTVTNTSVSLGDRVILNHQQTGTVGAYILNARTAGGQFAVDVRNSTAVNLSEAIVIGFVVVKGVTA